MNTYQPYTYLIGWSKLDRWYYGVRFAKNCGPADLWTSYFTSSKYVALLRKEHGEPDIIQVRRTFNSASAAQLWEERVLRKMNVLFEDKWINRNIAGAYIITDDIRKVISKANKGKLFSESTKRLIANKLIGIKRSDITKQKQSDIAKNRKIVVCPHCKKSGPNSAMSRWHFDNCTTFTGVKHKTGPCSNERRQAIKSSRKKTKSVACCHCGKVADPANIARHHNDNCKHR